MNPVLVEGVLWVPNRAEGPGWVGDYMAPLDPSDPEYDMWMAEAVQAESGVVWSDEPLTAAGWDPAQHPHVPAGSPEGGQWATKTLLEQVSDNGVDDRPKVKLPANPKVEGLNTAINQWLKGRGGNSMNWVNEIRYEMADMLGVPYYGDEPYDHGSYTQPPPTEGEARQAAAVLLEGLRQARPEMPELWRGMGAYEHEVGYHEAIRDMLDAKPGDTFTTLPVSMSTDPGIATMYSSALRYEGNTKLPGIMLRVVPGSRAIKPPRDFFGDREVLAAGEYKVLKTERVRWSRSVYYKPEPNDYDMLVLTVQQTKGIEAFD